VDVYTFLHPYTSACLHISTTIYLRIFTYCYTHIPGHATYLYTCIPAHVYITSVIPCKLTYVFSYCIPMHVYILIYTHTSASSYTSAPCGKYTCKFTYFNNHVSANVYRFLHLPTYACLQNSTPLFLCIKYIYTRIALAYLLTFTRISIHFRYY